MQWHHDASCNTVFEPVLQPWSDSSSSMEGGVLRSPEYSGLGNIIVPYLACCCCCISYYWCAEALSCRKFRLISTHRQASTFSECCAPWVIPHGKMMSCQSKYISTTFPFKQSRWNIMALGNDGNIHREDHLLLWASYRKCHVLSSLTIFQRKSRASSAWMMSLPLILICLLPQG